jgi:hypothetical protein
MPTFCLEALTGERRRINFPRTPLNRAARAQSAFLSLARHLLVLVAQEAP